jgi:hypothetical protein
MVDEGRVSARHSRSRLLGPAKNLERIDYALVGWFRAAAERFIQLDEWGVKSIWNLRP